MKESQLDNKTAIATNDYVRMVDENNNSVKIKKDSFMAAIRDALPSIISDGATGAGSVLSIIDGALKTRTDANLASVLGVPRKIFRATGDGTICNQLSDFAGGYDCAMIEIYGTTNTGNFYMHALVFVGKQTSITTSNTHIHLMVGTTTDFNNLVEIYTDGEDIFMYPKMRSGGGVVFTQSSCNIPPTVVTKDKSSLTRINISQ